MSLRLEMLQVARLAPAVLGEAVKLVESFIRAKQNADGGFCDREGASDLYYTVFAIDGLTALQAELPCESIVGYLQGFGTGDGLDFVHRCCLARVWSAMPELGVDVGEVLAGLEAYRTEDGGYNQKPAARAGSAYGCLLAYGAYADHSLQPPGVSRFGDCLDRLRTPDGAWGNEPGMSEGTATASAAAVTLARNLRQPIPDGLGEWLLGCAHADGGFRAFPAAPMPDLLSTAVVLHALDGLQVEFAGFKERCLDFVDSLWVNEGGFHGHWADEVLDLEYTYYGLLALGHLSL
jgi:prenyltransferase beta subunit